MVHGLSTTNAMVYRAPFGRPSISKTVARGLRYNQLFIVPYAKKHFFCVDYESDSESNQDGNSSLGLEEFETRADSKCVRQVHGIEAWGKDRKASDDSRC